MEGFSAGGHAANNHRSRSLERWRRTVGWRSPIWIAARGVLAAAGLLLAPRPRLPAALLGGILVGTLLAATHPLRRWLALQPKGPGPLPVPPGILPPLMAHRALWWLTITPPAVILHPLGGVLVLLALRDLRLWWRFRWL
ncbi:MAG: hypothetical protein ACFB51_13330 [Anaerolineae bacterium]